MSNKLLVKRPLPDSFENLILKQHNSLTEARYEMSALEKNIIYMLLSKLNNKDTSDTFYTINISELAKATKKEIRSDELKSATFKLITRGYTIKRDDGTLLQTALISSADYLKGGIIEIGIDKKIRPYLFDLKNRFTTFHFASAISLNSKYAKHIYEMLSQYKHTKIFKISVEALKYRLAIKDLETGADTYHKWPIFKMRILDSAQVQINGFTDINFTYIAKKTGKKFTDLEFKINSFKTEDLKHDQISDPKQITIEEELKDRMSKKYKLSYWQITEIINKVEISEIRATLSAIMYLISDHKIRDVGSYTAKVFEQKYNLGLFRGRY